MDQPLVDTGIAHDAAHDIAEDIDGTDVRAIVAVDAGRPIGAIDPRIYGGFIEHLGRCVYGGIYDEGSPLSDERGFRLDVLEALRRLRPTVLRWPGGNFVSGYHWTDGIGPKDRRPRRWDRAWKAEESNRFGTDEFLAYCAEVGAEPFICLNMGTGTMDESMAWLEYCNGAGNTDWANLRREHGHPEPYGVRYWGLGNEVWGPWQIGAMDADEYVRRARELAKVLRWTDPSIELVACGRSGWTDFDRVVIDGLVRDVDWHSIHLYTGSHQYYRNVLMPHQAERAIDLCRAMIDRAVYAQGVDHDVHIAYDEWNQWFRRAEVGVSHEDRYTLSDALAVATYLNAFVRHSRAVRMANLAQAVNAIAPIVTSPDGLFLQTIYHPLRLFAEHVHGTAIDVHVNGPTHDLTGEEDGEDGRYRVADLGPFQLLDVAAAARDGDGSVVLTVVNRHHSDAIRARVAVRGAKPGWDGTAWTVDGPSPDSVNSFEHPGEVTAREERVRTPGGDLTHTFPAHSLTVLELRR